MYTIEYKGGYIHGFCDDREFRVHILINGLWELHRCKTLIGAKRKITKLGGL